MFTFMISDILGHQFSWLREFPTRWSQRLPDTGVRR